MATNNRVFVSPGVYTSEVDLTFVAQSVGVTTLGLVGETLKGPAFEPILITNFDEFKTYFGTTSPEKDGRGYPKYELPYVAKSYLQESNQLFVTRILGLSGYAPKNSFGIQTLGGVSSSNSTWSSSLTGSTSVTYDMFTGGTLSTTVLTGVTSIDGTSDLITYINKTYSGFTNSDNGKWFVLGLIPTSGTTGLTSTLEQPSPLTGFYNSQNYNNKEWFNELVNSNNTVVNSYVFKYNSGTTQFDVTQYNYGAQLNTTYDGVVVASLRPRGHYHGENLVLEVTNLNNAKISGTTLNSNPFGVFTLLVTGTTLTGTTGHLSFDCSLSESSPNYIGKTLGVEVFDKSYSNFPLYLHEIYSNYLGYLYENGLIRGLKSTLVHNDETDVQGVSTFLKEWDTPMSPTIVSEVRGNKVDDLFDIITISDGESANTQIKVTIMNININTGEFDVVVRDFNDTDDNMAILERYSRCSMNPDVAGYVAAKIGTSDGQYTLNSKYIMLNMADNAPSNAFPAGFKGFTTNNSYGNNTLGGVVYKTNYFDAGETMYYNINGKPVISGGDKFKKVSLGLSTQTGFMFDKDLLMYKGTTAQGKTLGFHLSVNAANIKDVSGNTLYSTTGYDLESQTGDGNKLTNINYCKFTLAVQGGFDGWDIYRDTKTFGDAYVFGKSTYVSGTTDNGGVFSNTIGNSDYYAYLNGIQTYANPEAVDINVFATPGIDWYNNNSLTSQAIDVIETDRADSIYIMNAPGPVDFTGASAAADIADQLDTLGYDSNYSATFWPWIQVRDTDNATQIYLPPTGEVVRNIALTDNVSYPWFAVAGYSRGLVNSIKAAKKLTLDERDSLYKGRINPIATFSDTGTIIWGNKTLQVRESALDRINVRRLLLRARKLISAVAVRLLFEQNDDQVRQEFLRLVNPILESIKKERGLYDFRVSVSNAPEDIDANTLRGKIYVKPTRSLEFIDLEFVITPTGASFENI